MLSVYVLTFLRFNKKLQKGRQTMKSIKSCEFNIDTACIDVIYENGSMLSLYVPLIEESLQTTAYSHSKLDFLLDSDPLEYARMVLDGTIQEYVDIFDGYFHKQKNKISEQLQEKDGYSESMADDFAREILMYD